MRKKPLMIDLIPNNKSLTDKEKFIIGFKQLANECNIKGYSGMYICFNDNTVESIYQIMIKNLQNLD